MAATTHSSLLKVRNRVIDDHHEIRPRLSRMACLVAAIESECGASAERASALREEVLEFAQRFDRHLAYEDSRLVPLIARLDDWGKEHAAHMRREHREQREIVRRIADEARISDALSLAREVRVFVQCVRADMNSEERDLLLLVEDVTQIGACTG